MADDAPHLGHLYLTLGDVIQMTGVIATQTASEVEASIRAEVQIRLGNAGYPGAQLVKVVNDPEFSQGYIATVQHAGFPAPRVAGYVPVLTLIGSGTAYAVAWPERPVLPPVATPEPPNKPDQSTPLPTVIRQFAEEQERQRIAPDQERERIAAVEQQARERNQETARRARGQREDVERQRAAQTVPAVTPERPKAPVVATESSPAPMVDKDKGTENDEE